MKAEGGFFRMFMLKPVVFQHELVAVRTVQHVSRVMCRGRLSRHQSLLFNHRVSLYHR